LTPTRSLGQTSTASSTSNGSGRDFPCCRRTLPVLQFVTGENDSDEILMLMDYRLRSWLRSACLFPRPFKGLCVISQVANELKSGDLCSRLGGKFRDYRQQLIPWDQFEREVSALW